MRRHHLAGSVIDRLISRPQRSFPDRQAWAAPLAALGIAALEVLPDPATIATQGVMWGPSISTACSATPPWCRVLDSDAVEGQFRAGSHALCRVHAERLAHKLLPVTETQRRAVDLVRQLIWWLYHDVPADRSALQHADDPSLAAGMRLASVGA